MTIGKTTWYVILIGLLLIITLAMIPSTDQAFVVVALVTPIMGGVTTAVELLLKRQLWPGISLLCAIILIIATVAINLFMKGHQ